ncbi:MAG: SDR family NAD(P)-dependent oxidoreductase [Candidatus Hodarchaeota archaeon]
MKEFKNKVVVVTGAASGIGKGLASHCVERGMKVVLADIEEAPLQETKQSFQDQGAEVLAIRTDVSKLPDVEVLAEKTIETYGSVDLLFNNAGVIGALGLPWESTQSDWQWIIGVNLWGIIHGIKVFVPIMLRQGSDCHIVNTASIAGLSTVPVAAYAMTKHGIIGLTEALYLQLREVNARIGVSVLCPRVIRSRIHESDRNRPAELRNEVESPPLTPQQQVTLERFLKMLETAMTPEQYAEKVFNAIEEDKFYVFSEDKYRENIQQRMGIILGEGSPELSKHYP